MEDKTKNSNSILIWIVNKNVMMIRSLLLRCSKYLAIVTENVIKLLVCLSSGMLDQCDISS